MAQHVSVIRSGCLLLLLALATGLALLGSSGRAPTASAASCTTVPTFYVVGDALGVEGGSCKDVFDRAEEFAVHCGGSPRQVVVAYRLPPDPVAEFVSGFPCGSWSRLEVNGYSGPDNIDLSAVSRASGFTGITEPNVIVSGSEADEVVGSALPDSVQAGSGEDLVRIRDGGHDTADCGADFDSAQTDPRSFDALAGCELVDALPEVPCAGRNATIIGTARGDTLVGTAGNDVIAGLGGADSVAGLDGNDVICGGKGNDKLRGGKGRDRLLGGAGGDRLRGGRGRDRLRGGPGRDREVQ